ncbi:uncharacterized protein LOC117123254 [Anneissia japonica]|uniref:uncharacterized protein LOC117123254 n=1 Tax=Anneissia japonica TaxID=1529436 RepID=UPI0014258EC8|nr:uncharacterized protein LOC117123254 [Anneissia japonica]
MTDVNLAMINTMDVKSVFKTINPRKSRGPDGVSGKVLKACNEQLFHVFSRLYNWSLNSHEVAAIWKRSLIHPLAKIGNPRMLNDYRPIVLTAVPMKCFEKLVKCEILNETNDEADPYQFAYRPKRGVEDAITTLLHKILVHLESANAYARVLFLDFSSAFNTIKPHILMEKVRVILR